MTAEDILGAELLHTLELAGFKVVPIDEAMREAPAQLLAVPTDFDEFWAAWPHKVGKPAAQRAYKTARKAGVAAAVILAGVRRYIATKPVDRPWLNPATFLNQRRWEDMPAPVQQKPRGLDGVRDSLRREILNDQYDAREEGAAAGAFRGFPRQLLTDH